MEAHMKLRPLDLVNEGMYLCGLAHSPKNHVRIDHPGQRRSIQGIDRSFPAVS